MAELVSFGEPENESERKAFEYLRTHLPHSYKLFTNLEIRQGVEIYEIDVIILAPHCVYVVDVKNWHGCIDIYEQNWHPDNYQPFTSPLKKLRKQAKILSSAICDINRARQQELRNIHIQASVLMADVNLIINDYGEKDGIHITYLDERCIKYFQDKSYIPEHRFDNIKPYVSIVESAIIGKSSPKSSPLRYRDWQVEEKLSENELRQYTEYRAKKTTIGMSNLAVRLRVYRVDPLLKPDERKEQYKLISTAMLALGQIPSHQNILGIQDCFESPEHNSLVMVTEDIQGQVLSRYIKKQNLSWKRKLAIIKDILRGLKHVHSHGIIHRNITPDTILVTTTGQARLISFDYARISNRTSTIGDDIANELEQYAAYQAIECQSDPGKATIVSDLFSAGLVFYELLTGSAAFISAEHIYECSAEFPVKPSQANPQISDGWDRWLQKLCAFDAQDRFPDANAALKELHKITIPSIYITNDIIDNRYRVIKRLGHPGSFAIVYHVFDTIGEVERVLKLVTSDRISVYERLQQEYKILQKIPEHPYIVKVIWADLLKDGTPFIVFEYIEGQDVETVIQTKTLSLEKAIEIAKQITEGLAHLHHHKVFHQDIKPSNLLLTDTGVRIIDFNISVSDSDEITDNAGTQRYLPPDCKLTNKLTSAEKIDRDLYALGIVFYECVTGRYPFDEQQPPKGKLPINPHSIENCESLSAELVQLLMRIIAPKRKDRFTSAEEVLSAIVGLNPPSLLTVEKKSSQVNQDNSDLCLQNSDDLSDLESLTKSNTYAVKPSQPVLIKTKGTKFNLFEMPAFNDNNQINPHKPIVLDPTGLYEIPPGYIAITTEVEWIKFFGVNTSPCWVRGLRLCNWAREWLRVWDKLDLIAQEKQNPRSRLQRLFEPLPLPSEWTDRQILAVVTRIDSYPQDNPIAHLLADITETNASIWLAQATIDNLATWLAIQIPQECIALEQVWQRKFHQHKLAVYYQTEDKLMLLRRWLGIAEAKITDLPKYPLEIPKLITQEFDAYWERLIYETEAKILDNLNAREQVGYERIAKIASKILNNRPHWLTKERQRNVSTYLDYQQQESLLNKQPPPQPEALALGASPKQTLAWVTQNYLPFRRWEVVHQSTSETRKSEPLASSFVEWMLQHYPEMKFDAVADSLLNYSVASLVQNLCQSSAVLWVVIDGLGWLDHVELLSYLTNNNQLAIERDIEPRFSILPTKTEYAKWSLYAQLLPCDGSWVADASKAFAKMNTGERYTDGRVGKLHKDLQTSKHELYCWDTQQFDELYHTERDWQHLYNVKRPHTLAGIAREIESFVNDYSHPEDIQVVIASDHGQLLGVADKIAFYNDVETKGRIAIGKIDNSQFAVLDRERYGLPHDISVVRGSASLGSFSYNQDKKIIGSHGGLFPEEVVVGVSILRKTVQRHPVLVHCSGGGEANKSGELTIAIDNPNSVPLKNLHLHITNEQYSLDLELSLEEIVPANEKVTFKKQIHKLPELPPSYEGGNIAISGALTFEFPDNQIANANLSSDSNLAITQLYVGGFNIDDF